MGRDGQHTPVIRICLESKVCTQFIRLYQMFLEGSDEFIRLGCTPYCFQDDGRLRLAAHGSIFKIGTYF